MTTDNEPKTQAGRALLEHIQRKWDEFYGEDGTLIPGPAREAILAIEAEASSRVPEGENPSASADADGAAAPAALLELAEQYHSGHSVTGSPCRCRQCKQLAKLRKRRSEPAAAEPLNDIRQALIDYDNDSGGLMAVYEALDAAERAAFSSDVGAAQPPPPTLDVERLARALAVIYATRQRVPGRWPPMSQWQADAEAVAAEYNRLTNGR